MHYDAIADQDFIDEGDNRVHDDNDCTLTLKNLFLLRLMMPMELRPRIPIQLCARTPKESMVV